MFIMGRSINIRNLRGGRKDSQTNPVCDVY